MYKCIDILTDHETHTSSVHSETQSIFPRSLPNIQSRNCRPSLQSNQLTDNDEPEKVRLLLSIPGVATLASQKTQKRWKLKMEKPQHSARL